MMMAVFTRGEHCSCVVPLYAVSGLDWLKSSARKAGCAKLATLVCQA